MNPRVSVSVVDLSAFPSTPVVGPWAAGSTTPTFQLFEYNNQFSDEAYTANVVDDTGTTKSSTAFTVPLGQIGTVGLSTLPDFHLNISGPGIAGADLANQNLGSSPSAASQGAR